MFVLIQVLQEMAELVINCLRDNSSHQRTQIKALQRAKLTLLCNQYWVSNLFSLLKKKIIEGLGLVKRQTLEADKMVHMVFCFLFLKAACPTKPDDLDWFLRNQQLGQHTCITTRANTCIHVHTQRHIFSKNELFLNHHY